MIATKDAEIEKGLVREVRERNPLGFYLCGFPRPVNHAACSASRHQQSPVLYSVTLELAKDDVNYKL